MIEVGKIYKFILGGILTTAKVTDKDEKFIKLSYPFQVIPDYINKVNQVTIYPLAIDKDKNVYEVWINIDTVQAYREASDAEIKEYEEFLTQFKAELQGITIADSIDNIKPNTEQ